MQHNFHLAGPAFELKPVLLQHAPFIFNLRRDRSVNAYINETPDDYEMHRSWMREYFERGGDYYFVVADKENGDLQGTCAIYNLDSARNRAEWGRWVISPDSLAASESAFLIYSIAFEKLELKEVFCRTVANNTSVLSFHASCGLSLTNVESNAVSIDGKDHDLVEQVLTEQQWPELKNYLLDKCTRVASIMHRRREALT